MSDVPEVKWPCPDETYRDNLGRELLVTRVNKEDRAERHVVGELVVNRQREPYATSLFIFQTTWVKV